MTIKRGDSWGERRIPPANLPVVTSDAQAGELLTVGCREFLITGGDMWRTLGGLPMSEASSGQERTVVTIDSMLATYKFRETTTTQQRSVFAHAVFSKRCIGPSLYRFSKILNIVYPTDETYVMNAQFLGHWDMAPRSHPNDGRLHIMTVPASLPWRQRLQFRRRVLTGTHVPHPLIHVGSSSQPFSLESCGTLILDGIGIGVVEDLTISVLADSVTLWI